MQVYSEVEGLEYEPDYSGSFEEWEAREHEHQEKLTNHLKSNGYNGPNTGKVYYTPRGDGSAMYLIAHATRGTGLKSILIHLPYGDAWHCPNISYIPQKVIFDRAVKQDKTKKMFAIN